MAPPNPPTGHASTAELVESSFRALADHVRTGVVLLDSSGQPVFANAAARELLRPRSTEGSAPIDLADLLPRGIPELSRGRLSRGEHAAQEVLLGAADRERRLLLRSVPAEEPGGLSLLLVEDRTEPAALEASQVLASRAQAGSLLRTHLHDLKAPLNALALNVELLRRSLQGEEEESASAHAEQVATTEVLQDEIRRLGRSLDSFLGYAKRAGRSAGPIGVIDVRRSVRETARLVRRSAESAGIRLRTHVPGTAVRAQADDDLLREALLNLVLNAFEAHGRGREGRGREVRIRLEPGEREVRLLVEDEGPGIPRGLMGQVLEMNFTTKPGGTGIGLTASRSLVQAQGGRLRLKSRPGRGTTVEILLRAADESNPAADSNRRPHPRRRSHPGGTRSKWLPGPS